MFRNLDDVRAEAKRRFDEAVFRPTPENMARWQAINNFMFGKAHRFSEAFAAGRLEHPEWDWTATHPATTTVMQDIRSEAKAALEQFLRTIGPEAGLVWAGASNDPRFRLTAPIAAGFARTYGFELMVVSDRADALPEHPEIRVRPDNGILAKLGVRKLPALLLVKSPEARHPALTVRCAEPRTLVVGSASVEEIKRRILLALAPETDPARPVPNEAQPAGWDAARMLSGEAYGVSAHASRSKDRPDASSASALAHAEDVADIEAAAREGILEIR